jgi:hypothetical protein
MLLGRMLICNTLQIRSLQAEKDCANSEGRAGAIFLANKICVI